MTLPAPADYYTEYLKIGVNRMTITHLTPYGDLKILVLKKEPPHSRKKRTLFGSPPNARMLS